MTILTQSSARAGSAALNRGSRARDISSAPQVKQGSHTIVKRCGRPETGPTTTGSPIATEIALPPGALRGTALCFPVARTPRSAEYIYSRERERDSLDVSIYHRKKYTQKHHPSQCHNVSQSAKSTPPQIIFSAASVDTGTHTCPLCCSVVPNTTKQSSHVREHSRMCFFKRATEEKRFRHLVQVRPTSTSFLCPYLTCTSSAQCEAKVRLHITHCSISVQFQLSNPTRTRTRTRTMKLHRRSD